MNELEIRESDNGIVFEVRLHPRGDRDRIAGVINHKLKIYVSAAPVKNKANESMIRLLSKSLKVPRNAIVIKQGATGRNKLIEIDSITSAEFKNRLQSAGQTKGRRISGINQAR